MKKNCVYCEREIKDGVFCDSCWTVVPPSEREGNEERAEVSLYFPTSDYSSSDKKGYEMKQIHPSGKNVTKYRWEICTPDFPSEKNKITDPHCHAKPRDGKGKVRISLFESSNPKIRIKGKVKDEDLTEIEKLVEDNKAFIHEEWKKVWITAYEKYFKK